MAKKKNGPDIDATFRIILGMNEDPLEGQMSVEELPGGADLPEAEPQPQAPAPSTEDEEVKGKYKVLLRLDSSLEEPIRQAAAELGLPVTKFIEVLIRGELNKGNLKKAISGEKGA